MNLKSLLGQDSFFVLNKKLVMCLGVHETLLLTALIDAEHIFKEEWFYQTQDTLECLTTLTRSQQDKAIDTLISADIIVKELRGLPRKRYFKINKQNVKNLLDDNCKQVCKIQQTVLQDNTNSIAKKCNNKDNNNKKSNKDNRIKDKENKNKVRGEDQTSLTLDTDTNNSLLTKNPYWMDHPILQDTKLPSDIKEFLQLNVGFSDIDFIELTKSFVEYDRSLRDSDTLSKYVNDGIAIASLFLCGISHASKFDNIKNIFTSENLRIVAERVMVLTDTIPIIDNAPDYNRYFDLGKSGYLYYKDSKGDEYKILPRVILKNIKNVYEFLGERSLYRSEVGDNASLKEIREYKKSEKELHESSKKDIDTLLSFSNTVKNVDPDNTVSHDGKCYSDKTQDFDDDYICKFFNRVKPDKPEDGT